MSKVRSFAPQFTHSLFTWQIWVLGLLVLFVGVAAVPADFITQARSCDQAILHYRRTQADYEGWRLHVWGPTVEEVTWENPLPPSGSDAYGIYWIVRMGPGAESLNYIVHLGDRKDPGPDQTVLFEQAGCEIWLIQGQATQFMSPEEGIQALTPQITTAPTPDEDQVILHYRRSREDYEGWGLHIWGPTSLEVTWQEPLLPAGRDDYGLYWVVPMQPGAQVLNYIVHLGDEKDPGPDQSLDMVEMGREIWLIQGSGEQFTDPVIARDALLVSGVGDIKNKAQAHWLSEDVIAWPLEFGSKAVYRLHYDPEGRIQVTAEGLQGGQTILLDYVDRGLSPELAEKHPHLWNAVMLRIPSETSVSPGELLKGQLAVSVTGPDGQILGATALQIPGVLDDLYSYDGPLGTTFQEGTPTIRVWAPTAKSVALQLFLNSAAQTPELAVPMTWDPSTGVWSLEGGPDWKGKFYLFEVDVFVRQEGRRVKNLVTDPYSLSLAMNSTRSQIVDLDDPVLKPPGWDRLENPPFGRPTDAVIYELHLRDFSSRDPSVLEGNRGTYLAFTDPDTLGMQHLQRLAEAGLTHVHLLPLFDIATINEDRSTWLNPDFPALAALPPDSEEQQSRLSEVRGRDGYNWGYDPYHFTVPEGSYASDPDGSTRVLEFRQMVQGLHQIGLRVVMDVVYNHTNASGQSEKSVLDRIVPGYYHRLDADGRVATSTCCHNTASEHAMMEKLMLDSLRVWAVEYKVDGFRFDLMGHHMRSNMLNVRAMLDGLSPAGDGVDGGSIYLYGEGWDFGETANQARGVNATQFHMAGTGIGTFNDRIRDAVRGGGPFGGLQEQGFITGLFTDPNGVANLPLATQRALLLDLSDQLRISLAGNLADLPLINGEGNLVTGSQVNYNGAPAGYTQKPQENVVYISAHDNETLFDAIQYKAPLKASLDERVRMQNLGISLVSLSQGVPFFHAGVEMLRSKSLDRDSYDSGDWFNALDFTYQQNNWGAGLPPQDKNGANWPVMKSLLARPELKPSSEHIQATLRHFEELLRIRFSSPLFRLDSAAEIQARLRFFNTGPQQMPGLIAMGIADTGPDRIDPNFSHLLVFYNASPETRTYQHPDLTLLPFELHPIQRDSADPLVRKASFDPASRSFTIPGRTTAVFVVLRENSQQAAIEAEATPFRDEGRDVSEVEAVRESAVQVRDNPLAVGFGLLVFGGIALALSVCASRRRVIP